MSHVQSTSENSFSAGTTGTLALTDVVGGRFLLAFTRVATGASNVVSGVASNLDGAFTLLTEENNGTIVLRTWYLENASAGAHTITYTTVGTGITVRWGVAEYGDVPETSVIDASADGAFTTTTTPSTSNVTTTGTNRTIVSVIATDLGATSIAPAGGETERQEVNERLQFQDEAAASAGSHGASWTLGATQPGVYAIIALRPAAGALNKYLKLLTHADAQSKTGVAGVVFAAPSGSDLTGDKIGEFTAQAFEATLEGGEAVLLVDVADFGGSALTTSDTPRVEIRYDDAGTIKGTAIVPATVIEA
jgi:hypothetical protein